MLRVVNWTKDAWRIIQSKALWDWMWESVNITIPAGQSVAVATVPARRYVRTSAHIGTSELTYRPWQEFTRENRVITSTVPDLWTIRPDGAFVCNATPAADTVISVERYKVPTELVDNTDVPALPPHLHMAIVWKALIEAADYDEAGATKANARLKYAELLGDAMRDSTPSMELGAPLL